jgi:hypothetical protein
VTHALLDDRAHRRERDRRAAVPPPAAARRPGRARSRARAAATRRRPGSRSASARVAQVEEEPHHAAIAISASRISHASVPRRGTPRGRRASSRAPAASGSCCAPSAAWRRVRRGSGSRPACFARISSQCAGMIDEEDVPAMIVPSIAPDLAGTRPRREQLARRPTRTRQSARRARERGARSRDAAEHVVDEPRARAGRDADRDRLPRVEVGDRGSIR